MKHIRPAEIFASLCVCGQGFMNEGNVRKWCHFLIEEGQICTTECSQNSVITKNLKDRFDAHVPENSDSLLMSFMMDFQCFVICPL
jgi:hypothetical protein